MEFANVSNDMQREFMMLYNEKVGKRPFYWSMICAAVFLVVGYFVMYKIIVAAGWYGGYVPTWFLLILFAWFVVGPVLGIKLGFRLYLTTHRDSIVTWIQRALSKNEYLTDEQKQTLQNYTAYYVDTSKVRFRDL